MYHSCDTLADVPSSDAVCSAIRPSRAVSALVWEGVLGYRPMRSTKNESPPRARPVHSNREIVPA
jgi:hypothetical protein